MMLMNHPRLQDNTTQVRYYLGRLILRQVNTYAGYYLGRLLQALQLTRKDDDWLEPQKVSDEKDENQQPQVGICSQRVHITVQLLLCDIPPLSKQEFGHERFRRPNLPQRAESAQNQHYFDPFLHCYHGVSCYGLSLCKSCTDTLVEKHGRLVMESSANWLRAMQATARGSPHVSSVHFCTQTQYTVDIFDVNARLELNATRAENFVFFPRQILL